MGKLMGTVAPRRGVDVLLHWDAVLLVACRRLFRLGFDARTVEDGSLS